MSYFATWEQRAHENSKPHAARVSKARTALCGLDPEALEAIAEAAIGLLDELSDPDEDHCLAGDEGCGPFVGGQVGGVHWGSQADIEIELASTAKYGIDQREIMGRFGVTLRVG